MLKNLVTQTLVFHFFRVSIFFCFRSSCHDYLSQSFCLRVPKVFVEEPFCAAFQKISGSENFMDKTGGGVEYRDFPPTKLLSHIVGRFHRGIIRFFINFGYQKSLDERGGGVTRFYVEISFCPSLPKKFVEERFSVSLISGIEKFHASKGYVSISVGFLSDSSEKFRRGTLLCCVSENFR